jgi:outer membrane protein assembly factor BamA
MVNQAQHGSITSDVGISTDCRLRTNPFRDQNRALRRGRLVCRASLLLLFFAGFSACVLGQNAPNPAPSQNGPAPAQNAEPAKNSPAAAEQQKKTTPNERSTPAENAHPAATTVPNFPGSPSGMLSPYEGQKVSSIQVAGRIDVNAEKFAPQFVQKLGEPFSQQQVQQTAAAIKSAGNFENVRIDVNPEAEGVRVIYVVEPSVYYGIFKFPGAERFPYSRLIQIANYPIQAPFNSAEVETDLQALLKFYRQVGYFQADLRSETHVDEQHAVANVSFPVTLGHRAKFGNIVIEGVAPPEQKKMADSLETVMARFRTVAIRPGKNYSYGTLSRATTYLQNQMQKKGLLDAQVKLSGAEYHADTNRADIHFNVTPGEVVDVNIEGAHVWPWTKKSLLPAYQGIGVDQESVEEGRKALVSYFQSKGYFDVKVESRFDKRQNRNTILYRISKEKKHKVDEIKLAGNSQIHADQLTPHIAVEKKHFLSSGKFSEQLVNQSVKNLKGVYAAEGFSSVTVVPTVTRQSGDVVVSFRVNEGPRDVVSSLQVQGADTFPPAQYAPEGLKLAAGQPYSTRGVQSDRANVIANYLRAGYLNASFRETASPVSKKDPHRINVVYHIYEGPRVLTGDILTLGRLHTDQKLIDRNIAMLKPEQPLTATGLLTAGSKLYDLAGVFDWAEVDPKTQITSQTNEDVLVKVHEAKRNEITYGFGFEVINRGGSVPGGTAAVPGLPPIGLPADFTTSQQTFWGPRGTFQYTRNNVRGKGESISLTGFGGRLDQRFAFYYIDPNFRWTNWRATTSFSAEHNQENPIFSSQQEIGGVQLQRYIDKARKNTLFVRYQFSQTNLTHVLIPELIPSEDQNVQLSTIAVNMTRDTRDNPLDEHRGWLQSIELDNNSTWLGSSVNFAKLTGQVAYYKQAIHNIVWANSLRIGLAQPYSDSRVPLSEKFFTGGSNSLRGYPLDGAGPQRPVQVCSNGGTDCGTFISVPAGGRQLLLINAEARIPVPIKQGLGVVPFYDGGNVFPGIGFNRFLDLYSNNVGFGLRYATPVGPIRVDIGYNLNNPVKGVSRIQYFITIGQAF